MRSLTAAEETLLARHLALNETRDRYEIHARFLASASELLADLAEAIETGLEPSPENDENIAEILTRRAQRVRQRQLSLRTVEAFTGMRDANFDQLQEALDP